MIGKHVDLIAIGLLLGGAALYTGARDVARIQIAPYTRTALSQTIQRAMRCSRSAKIARGVAIQGTYAVPDCPTLPRLSITTD